MKRKKFRSKPDSIKTQHLLIEHTHTHKQGISHECLVILKKKKGNTIREESTYRPMAPRTGRWMSSRAEKTIL